MVAISPLRYPGGKASLLATVSQILSLNNLQRGHYAEPYAGGCGLALALLFGGHVSDIHINDIDPSIWSFWHCVLNRTEELVEKIKKTSINVGEWHNQREIQLRQNARRSLELGFSTFFLNRTNRSGIIKAAGVIGGLLQDGPYKIDCRFNKEDLIRRIRRVEKYKNRIHLSKMDAVHFLRSANKMLPANTFLCIDPPYFNKGSSLYTSFYDADDHTSLSNMVMKLKYPWIVTYDNVEEIQKLYRMRRQFAFDIAYSVQTKRLGTELLIASKGLRIPDQLRDRQTRKPSRQVA